MIDAVYWDALERVAAFSQRKIQKKDSRK